MERGEYEQAHYSIERAYLDKLSSIRRTLTWAVSVNAVRDIQGAVSVAMVEAYNALEDLNAEYCEICGIRILDPVDRAISDGRMAAIREAGIRVNGFAEAREEWIEGKWEK